MSLFLPSKDPPEKFKRVVARFKSFSFLESAKSDRLLAQVLEPAPTSPEQLAIKLKSYVAERGKLTKALGIQANH